MDTPVTSNHDQQSPSAAQNSNPNDDVVSRSAARSALSLLEERGSNIPDKLRQQINAQYKELLRELGHDTKDSLLVITPDQLRGVIASSVIIGAAQVALERNVLATESVPEEAKPALDNDLALEPA
jgi:hypothetical protein